MHETPEFTPTTRNGIAGWTHNESGRWLPLVRGGDGPEEGGSESGSTEGAPTGEPATTGEAGGTPAASEATGTPPAETFDRPYVEQLRQENARRRVEAKAFEDAFTGYNPDERQAFLDIAAGLADPTRQEASAKRLQQIANELLESEGAPRRPTGDVDPDQQPLTRAEFEKLSAERAEQQGIQDGIRQIVAEAKQLGYVENSPDYNELLFHASSPDVAGDLTKAHAKVQARKQEIIDSYAKDVAANGERWPAAATAATAAAAMDGGPPKDFKSARKGALAWLNARPGSAG